MTDQQPIMMRATMYADGANGLRIQEKECVDYPGIKVHSLKPSKNEEWITTISYNNQEYTTIFDAIEAWQTANP